MDFTLIMALFTGGLGAVAVALLASLHDRRRRGGTVGGAALESLVKGIEEREARLAAREDELAAGLARAEELRASQVAVLEELSGLSADEARQLLLERFEEEARVQARRAVREAEARAAEEAERRARDVLCTAMQRLAGSTVTPATAVTIALPSPDMKARIVGKEGRNIRCFEHETGVNLVVDETPHTVLLSCFDPVRREVGRLALVALLEDGRIHPTTIEAAVADARDRVELDAEQAGREAAEEARVEGLSPELLRRLGQLSLRNSYGQQVLQHSIETAQLAGLMAAELGVPAELVRRAGLLHDIGKAVSHEEEGSHARVGAELAAACGESAEVCHAIEAHHREVEPRTVEAVLVQVADSLSLQRPGGRRDQLDQYARRLRRIEKLCEAFEGVERAYAMQSGHDVRVMVRPEIVGDAETRELARSIAERIEQELAYNGRINITVVRELRAVAVAS